MPRIIPPKIIGYEPNYNSILVTEKFKNIKLKKVFDGIMPNFEVTPKQKKILNLKKRLKMIGHK